MSRKHLAWLVVVAAVVVWCGVSAAQSEATEHLASPASGEAIFGDMDCTKTVDALDALWILQGVSGMSHIAPFCSPSDIDCDGDTDVVDALAILRGVAGLPVIQVEGCPQVGATIQT